jgi:glycosyltransferase involved in cell wall biosynthesis
MSELKISVIIATYNRCDTITATLDCLSRQTLDPQYFEVIVVDDGSTDKTESVMFEKQKSVRYKLTYMKHPNRGPGYTQNQGIRAAAAPIICLIADDIHLVPEALESYLKDHEQHPEENVAVLGKVLQSPDAAQSVFLGKWDPFKFRLLENCRELPYYLFWACNITVKRDFLLENGLFREEKGRAGAAAHEDVELGYRLYKKGLKLLYNKNALGYHYHIETLEGAIRRAYQRGLNWEEFRGLVDDPEITVRYHILNWHTIRDHVNAFRNPQNLMGPDRSIIVLLVRQMMRISIFNFITIPMLWLPLTRLAERNQAVARLMHRQLYRGVISYHFFKGARDGLKIFPRPVG